MRLIVWCGRLRLVQLLVLFLGLMPMTPAAADSLQFSIRSNYQYSVSVEFYARATNRAWPGGGEVWVIRDTDIHRYNLNCNSGEKICYGAWSRGNPKTYWGVGKEGKKGCQSCCYTCGEGDTPVINLNP